MLKKCVKKLQAFGRLKIDRKILPAGGYLWAICLFLNNLVFINIYKNIFFNNFIFNPFSVVDSFTRQNRYAPVAPLTLP